MNEMSNETNTSQDKETELTPKKKRHPIATFFKLLLFVILTCCLLACLGLVAYVGSCVAKAPEFDPDNLPKNNLTSFIYDKNGDLITDIHGSQNRIEVSIEEVPQIIVDAFVSTEDIRFYEHHGVDIVRIAGAFLANMKSGEISEGASTITMQVAQNLYLPDQKNVKTYERKIQEAYLAFKLENHFSKDKIMEMYLNTIYFGEGSYGVEAACECYFGKNVSEIDSVQEAALLAGLPNAPTAFDPFINPEWSAERRNIIISNMVRYGVLTEEEAAIAREEELELDTSESPSKYDYPYFVDAVIADLIETYGDQAVYQGGLKVYTTLDPEIQTYAEEAMANEDNFPYSSYDDKGQLQPEGACVIMEAGTGYVSALVGGREHLTSLQFNRATQALRQPGSAFKPIIVYGPALEYLNWGTGNVVKDEKVTYGSWSPENSGGGHSGPVTIRYAVKNSINVVAVKTLEQVGIENGLTFAKSLGISTLDEENDCGLALALGGIYNGVSVLEMTAAYGAYANEGAYCKPLLYTKVTSSKLEIDDEYAPEEKQVMKKTTAYLMTSMLESVVSSGTGTAAYIGRPMAGKTGTTDAGKDIWFCGYTPDYVGAVWIGYDEPTAMYNSYGSMYPTVVWKEIMSQVHEDLPVRDFENPGGIVSATICTQTGKLATRNCGSVSNELYASGYAPKDYCDGYISVSKNESDDKEDQMITICKESGLLATKYCPNTEEISESSDNVPTETCSIHAQAEKTAIICTESGLLATDYCPSTKEVSSYEQDLPNGSCNIHTAPSQTDEETNESDESVTPDDPEESEKDTDNEDDTTVSSNNTVSSFVYPYTQQNNKSVGLIDYFTDIRSLISRNFLYILPLSAQK